MTDDSERYRLLLLGVDDDEYHWVLDNLVDSIERHGIEVETQHAHPKPDAADARAALADEDMRRKNASWIRDVSEKVLSAVLEHPEQVGDEIWGFSAIVESDWNAVVDAIDNLPEMETAESVILFPDQAHPHQGPDMEYQTDPPKNPNAPFSYDPAQDFKTEPDRS